MGTFLCRTAIASAQQVKMTRAELGKEICILKDLKNKNISQTKTILKNLSALLIPQVIFDIVHIQLQISLDFCSTRPLSLGRRVPNEQASDIHYITNKFSSCHSCILDCPKQVRIPKKKKKKKKKGKKKIRNENVT